MSNTKAHIEQRIMKRRDAEAKDLDLRRRLAEHNLLAGHGHSAVRVDAKRRSRSEAAERRELWMDYQHVTSEQEKSRRKQIAQFEDHIAEELSRRKASGLRQEMDKRRICDGSEELRALKERLHMAKVNKERAQQLLEIAVREKQERHREQHIAEHMEDQRLGQVELELKLNLEKGKQRERVKVINQQQIATRELQKDEAMHEFQKEKAQVQELVDRIAREDREELEVRRHKQEETKGQLRKFMVEQKERKEIMMQQEKDEIRKIEEYAIAKRAREERLAQEKEEAEREKVRILNAMLGKMEARNKETEELELLRNDLHLEELEAENRRRDEMQMRKKLEDQQEMKNAYTYQTKLKEERAAKAREEEEQIREQLMRKFAEDDRIEQMNEHKRRMKLETHKREAERLIRLRREMYEQERERERQADSKSREDEATRQTIIEEERRRLIAEHAADLRDFLPKGTLDTEEDYKLMFDRPPKSA